ncbi:hypothetical protein EPA93_06085 [Ktedonosporobacter rubrisoli]|uniref:Uncharacterized protein n=1 Tax=Ktedonosporobacter rubrisoli TaxID=2509675 RepID=A0A4P6JKC1_KTERU|nr:hypothetical protein [Ktedonosporobacter rubrisoli]QBD75595.1 hypothetical protein EPA93_06085 [Ktedonosporobacter rubrisoli]
MQPLEGRSYGQISYLKRSKGCGTTFLGIRHDKKQGYSFATVWSVFWYMPIVPRGRYCVEFGKKETRESMTFLGGWKKSASIPFRVLEETPLVRKEILLTYLLHWLPFAIVCLYGLLLFVATVRFLGLESVGIFIIIPIFWMRIITSIRNKLGYIVLVYNNLDVTI